jgi:hypothetical protein
MPFLNPMMPGNEEELSWQHRLRSLSSIRRY